MSGEPTLLDEFIPIYDVSDAVACRVYADAKTVYSLAVAPNADTTLLSGTIEPWPPTDTRGAGFAGTGPSALGRAPTCS